MFPVVPRLHRRLPRISTFDDNGAHVFSQPPTFTGPWQEGRRRFCADGRGLTVFPNLSMLFLAESALRIRIPTRRPQREARCRRPWSAVRGISQNLGPSNIVIDLSHKLEDIRYFSPLNTKFWFTINQTPVTAMPSLSRRQGREQTPPHSSPLLSSSLFGRALISPRSYESVAVWIAGREKRSLVGDHQFILTLVVN